MMSDNPGSNEDEPGRDKCPFCQICDGKADGNIAYQDTEIVAFADIRPAATHHYLIVPRAHIKNAKVLKATDVDLVEKLVAAGKQTLENCGADVENTRWGFHWPPCNTISHLHLHVISPVDDMNFISRIIFRPGLWFVTPEYVVERLKNQL